MIFVRPLDNGYVRLIGNRLYELWPSQRLKPEKSLNPYTYYGQFVGFKLLVFRLNEVTREGISQYSYEFLKV